VAILVEVDGKRVLAIGDQYQDSPGDKWNYVYQNGFALGDYRQSAALYHRLQPDLLLSGHWEPQWVEPGYFERVTEIGETLDQLHRDLLPLERVDFGAGGVGARIEPYQARAAAGTPLMFVVHMRNPFAHAAEAEVGLVVPAGWQVEPAEARCQLQPATAGQQSFIVTPPPGLVVRRARLAADLTVDGRRFGQQAEALVTLS
jgi:hypothetical protein